MKNLEIVKISTQRLFRTARGKANKSKSIQNQTGTIYFRLSCPNQKPIEISSKVSVNRKDWDCKKGVIKGRLESIKLLNEKLDQIERKLQNVEVDLLRSGDDFNIQTIKEIITGEHQRRHDLIIAFKEMKNSQSNDVCATTNKHYGTTLKYLLEFIRLEYNNEMHPISKVDYDFIYAFDRWLRNEKNCKDGGANKHHFRLQKLLTIGRKRRLIDFNPYDEFEINVPKPSPKYLEESELSRIEKIEFETGSKLDKVRDGFLFCCYTGLSFSDFRRLKRSDITDREGRKIIIDQRNKTNISFAIMLIKDAIDLLKKYDDDLDVILNDCLIPSISNQPTNRYLKEIQNLCGITKNLTFHVSRHTFATTVILKRGGTMENLQKMMGHADIKTTQIYAKILDDSAIDEMHRIEKSRMGEL